MSHHLYQLRTKAPVGAKVHFNGIWDRYGIVLKHQDSGYHLIRGTGRKAPEGTTYYAEVEH